MEATRPQDNDEINLIEFIETVWDGKWKIVFIVALSVLGMLGFQLVAPSPSFIATTEIKPITSVEAGRYRASNTFGFLELIKTCFRIFTLNNSMNVRCLKRLSESISC